MLKNRSYRQTMTCEEVVAEVGNGSGTPFEQCMVDAFFHADNIIKDCLASLHNKGMLDDRG